MGLHHDEGIGDARGIHLAASRVVSDRRHVNTRPQAGATHYRIWGMGRRTDQVRIGTATYVEGERSTSDASSTSVHLLIDAERGRIHHGAAPYPGLGFVIARRWRRTASRRPFPRLWEAQWYDAQASLP